MAPWVPRVLPPPTPLPPPLPLLQANNSNSALMRHLLSSGYIQDHGFFAGRLRKLLGDLTFLDAYQRSGACAGCWPTAACCSALLLVAARILSLNGVWQQFIQPHSCSCTNLCRAGRILSISVTAADTKEPSRLLNYLTGLA